MRKLSVPPISQNQTKRPNIIPMYTIYISLSRKDTEHTKKCNAQLITSTNPKSKIFSDILQIYYDEKF